MDSIPPTTPIWIILLVIIIREFKDPLANMLFKIFPQMAVDRGEFHRSRQDRSQTFDQEVKLKVLQDQLEHNVAERAGQALREKNLLLLINYILSLVERLTESNRSDEGMLQILAEIERLRVVIDKLSASIDASTRKEAT